ncbi:MAG: SurA N-terminal domain-containing protein [Candidatus Sedimenticola sp. 6PFRAG7]
MLQTIRERAQGVIAWIIVILISVPFALWGIQEYLGVGTENIIATVNDQEITEREFDTGFREFKQNLRERMGKNYRPELIDDETLRKEVLEAMIRNTLVLQASNSLGLRAGDDAVRETIRSIAAFQVGGVFNQEAYERAVRTQGLTTSAFFERVRQSIVSEQLNKAISGSEFATSAEIADLVRLQQQQRELGFITVPVAPYLEQVSVTEEEVRSHYDSNQAAYMAPERVKVEYLELDLDGIADALSVDEEMLEGYYEQHKTEYVSLEQRRASHILFAVEEGADDAVAAEAESAAKAALDRINAGEDFAAVAKELSQDPGSADMGGDLDYFEKGIMATAFDEAVFSMTAGAVSEPVKTEFGFHIIKLTDVRAPKGKTFDESREDIRKAYLRSEAERLFYEYAERLSDHAYEDPGSLEPAADALKIAVQQSDWITRSGGQGVFASSKVIGAAFSEDVLLEGNNSEAVELSPEHIVVLRVKDHEESTVKAFDQVQSDIERQLKADKASTKAREKGRELLAALRSGSDLSQLADQEGLTVVKKGFMERGTGGVAAPILRQLFDMPRPAAGGSTYADTELANGDVAIVALTGVKDGEQSQIDKLGGAQALGAALTRAKGESYYQKMVQNLRDSADVQILRKDQ